MPTLSEAALGNFNIVLEQTYRKWSTRIGIRLKDILDAVKPVLLEPDDTEMPGSGAPAETRFTRRS